MQRNQLRISEKQWNPKLELALIQQWGTEEHYRFTPEKNQLIFVIDTPPVYPSGEWHIGATAAYAMLDMIARYERMKGKAVLFPFCLDRNGINIELTVEKKYNKPLHDFDREEFIQLCRETIDGYSQKIIALSKRIGISADYSPGTYYETDSTDYRAFSQACFLDLWNKGLVYEDQRPIFFCPECRTTIAEAEIYYEERLVDFVYLRFSVKETGDNITIATTRPELLCACQAVLIHPNDTRYNHLHGKTAKIPYYNREVPILPHHSVKPQFGTGVVMVCSYGDLTDIQVFRDLQLKPIVAIDNLGQMTKAVGEFQGMTPEEARKAICKVLLSHNLIDKIEPGSHNVPICERSRTPIELISLPEWYIKQSDFAKNQIHSIIPKIRFLPDKNKQILIDWANSITIDWPISRRRFYHTEIPIWFCESCQEPFAPEPGQYYRPWCEPAPIEKCPKCGSKDFRGETRVFDTWVDSSVTNLYVTRFLRDPEFFRKVFPCTLRPQGRDIVRTWLFTTILRSFYHTKKPAFQTVWIHGMGLDEHGQAQSKTRGNVLHPGPILKEVGADAFRLWAASETNVGEDFRISKRRMIGAKKFLTKLWNVARFISGLERVTHPIKLHSTDRWIISEMNELISNCEKSYDQYNFFVPASNSRHFIREIFAGHYLEMTKGRAYNGDKAAIYTLHFVLETMLRFLAPITPFIADYIYRRIYDQTVHTQAFPEIKLATDSALTALTDELLAFNSSVWRTKKRNGLALNAQITGIRIPSRLLPFKDDLSKMHGLV